MFCVNLYIINKVRIMNVRSDNGSFLGKAEGWSWTQRSLGAQKHLTGKVSAKISIF